MPMADAARRTPAPAEHGGDARRVVRITGVGATQGRRGGGRAGGLSPAGRGAEGVAFGASDVDGREPAGYLCGGGSDDVSSRSYAFAPSVTAGEPGSLGP